MNFVTLVPIIIQALTAIQPVLSGASAASVSSAGSSLVPVIERLLAGIAPGSLTKVQPAMFAITSVFDPNIVKWIQQVLNLTGAGLVVDGELGPRTLAAIDAFAQKEIGILPNSLISEVLHSALQWAATKSPSK